VRISFTKNEFAGNLALQTGISFCNSSQIFRIFSCFKPNF